MKPLRHIRVISDGRPGHENQSVGLAQALARRTGAELETTRIPQKGWLWSRCRAASALSGPVPDLVLGAGHEVHLPMWYAARRFHARSVVIMKPSWPHWLFDLCVLPQHDSPPATATSRIILSFGALNRLPEAIPPKQANGIVLIGGPAWSHGWSAEPLRAAIGQVVTARPDLNWTISDSRRTPAGFLEELRRAGLPAELLSHQQTKPEWLPAQLTAAQEAWVTEDSISMIFEAVTAGARTGILPMPVLAPGAHRLHAIHRLVQEQRACDYATWQRDGRKLPTPKPFHETGRCADEVLQRLFAAAPPGRSGK